jgi:hypothetical protein
VARSTVESRHGVHVSSALKLPTPMQLNKIHAYLLTAGLLHPPNASEKSATAIRLTGRASQQ